MVLDTTCDLAAAGVIQAGSGALPDGYHFNTPKAAEPSDDLLIEGWQVQPGDEIDGDLVVSISGPDDPRDDHRVLFLSNGTAINVDFREQIVVTRG
jgi:hypothetical protein